MLSYLFLFQTGGCERNRALEFAHLKPHNTVYKLVGPSLVPQEQAEARVNVEKRLEYIRNEVKRVETQLKESEERGGKKKEEIIALQQELQAMQGPRPPGEGKAVKV
ncbi:MAG: hypothetical protein TREMPRED_005819 [Tremellales sp. Tagirdzhanova-0007]|nr:MAG: hypothetical protein TREMPRED_005819 [Tremellales sp. Tagirdzhanova-0007]